MLNKTKKFVKEHKTEIVLGIIVVGEIVLLKDKFIKPETSNIDSNIDKVNLEKILDDMQNKIRDNKFEILDIKESLEK